MPRIALALDLKLPVGGGASSTEASFERIAFALSRHLKIRCEDLLRVFHRGRLIIWTPIIRGENAVAADRRIAAGTLFLVKGAPQIDAVGIGLMNHGPAGWAMSAEEAFKAMDSGRRLNADKRLYQYSDIAVDEGARKLESVSRYLDSLLERLSAECDLKATLQMYFDQFQRRKVTAVALGIHPNTLNYRLGRIEALLGANLEDAGWISKLHTALNLRRRSCRI